MIGRSHDPVGTGANHASGIKSPDANGLDKFDKAYENGIIDKVLTTNLIYQTPELLQREWYINCDMSKYIAYIIDTLNHDSSISDLLNPNERIQNIVAKYKTGEL